MAANCGVMNQLFIASRKSCVILRTCKRTFGKKLIFKLKVGNDAFIHHCYGENFNKNFIRELILYENFKNNSFIL